MFATQIFRLLLYMIIANSLFLIHDCDAVNNKVLLSDITTLTLRKDQSTSSRRAASIPQLQCVGGSAKGQPEPKVVQCYNRGFDGVDIQWECKAEMNKNLQFGNIRVSCEGYDYSDDPYVLKGSCGMMYELEYVNDKQIPSAPPAEEDEKFGLSSFFTLVMVLFFVYVVYSACYSGNSGGRQNRAFWGGWDGGPPPPPSSGPPPPGFKTFHRPAGAPPSYEESCRGTSAESGQNSSGPGFFSGLGLGGLAGYMFGRNQNSGGNFFRNRRFGDSADDTGFWGMDRQRRHDTSGPSSSHTSSGFGGTVRR